MPEKSLEGAQEKMPKASDSGSLSFRSRSIGGCILGLYIGIVEEHGNCNGYRVI